MSPVTLTPVVNSICATVQDEDKWNVGFIDDQFNLSANARVQQGRFGGTARHSEIPDSLVWCIGTTLPTLPIKSNSLQRI